jgi:hypothetical protein
MSEQPEAGTVSDSSILTGGLQFFSQHQGRFKLSLTSEQNSNFKNSFHILDISIGGT